MNTQKRPVIYLRRLTPDSPRHRDELARGIAVWDEVAYAAGTPDALATQ